MYAGDTITNPHAFVGPIIPPSAPLASPEVPAEHGPFLRFAKTLAFAVGHIVGELTSEEGRRIWGTYGAELAAKLPAIKSEKLAESLAQAALQAACRYASVFGTELDSPAK